MIDETFLDDLPDDPILAGKEICARFEQFESYSQTQKGTRYNKDTDGPLVNALLHFIPNIELHDEYVMALGAFEAFCDAHGFLFEFPDLEEDQAKNIRKIIFLFSEAKSRFNEDITYLTLARAKEAFSMRLGKNFFYEFSTGDINKIQTLINLLRDEISKAEFIEEKHKQRLLKRLEKTQSEIHKRVSDLDRFWGLVGDAGVVLGKFGEDAKPIVDRIKEITNIVWRTQARAEELPSDIPIPAIGDSKQKED